MKYFIDFEAMQFSNYIISVGCVREDGKEFYSLVHTPENTKKNVSKFITDLTGITTEMVSDAPSPEEVFNKFFDFCFDVFFFFFILQIYIFFLYFCYSIL